MLVVVSNWHLYYSQQPVCLIYYIGYMSNPKSLAFSMTISRLIIETQGIEMCLSCHDVTRMASHLPGLNRSSHFSAQSLNLLRASCRVRTYTDIHIFKFFKCINSKIVRQKNNKDRECQAITEVYLILLSLRQKNFLTFKSWNEKPVHPSARNPVDWKSYIVDTYLSGL